MAKILSHCCRPSKDVSMDSFDYTAVFSPENKIQSRSYYRPSSPDESTKLELSSIDVTTDSDSFHDNKGQSNFKRGPKTSTIAKRHHRCVNVDLKCSSVELLSYSKLSSEERIDICFGETFVLTPDIDNVHRDRFCSLMTVSSMEDPAADFITMETTENISQTNHQAASAVNPTSPQVSRRQKMKKSVHRSILRRMKSLRRNKFNKLKMLAVL